MKNTLAARGVVSAPTTRSAPGELPLRLAQCAATLVRTARDLRWRGSDPYDGLYWQWPAALLATPLRRQAVVQLHARSPIDLRRWRRHPGPRLAKTLALFSNAALLAHDSLGSDELRPAAREAIEALSADHSAGPNAWGYPFMVQTRWSSYPANSPNIVVTSFAIDALWFAAQRLDEPAHRARAREAGNWLTSTLLTANGHFAYHEHSETLIHNANMLGAAAVFRSLDDRSQALRAAEITLDAQRPDGSWPYGEGAGLSFVDSFHTGYILRSLMTLRPLDRSIDQAIVRGARYWCDQCFDDEGRARLWPGRRYPEDGHSTGTALSTLALLCQLDFADESLLRKVAERALLSMVHHGRAVHRRYRWGRSHVRYLRWCDGHMAVGMAAAASALGGPAGATGIT